MDARAIGRNVPIDDVEIGKCVIFSVHSSAELGIIVSISQDKKGILHFDAVRDGIKFPTIYEMDSLYNEKCLVIDSARVVPVLSVEHVGFGRFERNVSQVLYITKDSVIVNALKGQSYLPINLLTGSPDYLESSNSIYTKAWYLEVISADGSYEPYHEFRCEPSP